jgi:predicted DNA-binding transcriptional regulator YafY
MEKFKITERTVYRDLNALSIVEHTGNGLYRLIIPHNRPADKDYITHWLTS